MLILSAVTQVDRSAKRLLWSNAMRILNEMDSSSSDVVILIITLFNTILSIVPDQDTFYDMADALEKQGMQRCTQFYLNKKPSESELIEQFNIYDVSSRISLCLHVKMFFFNFRLLFDVKMVKMIQQLFN
jgi:hypothetical protein